MRASAERARRARCGTSQECPCPGCPRQGPEKGEKGVCKKRLIMSCMQEPAINPTGRTFLCPSASVLRRELLVDTVIPDRTVTPSCQERLRRHSQGTPAGSLVRASAVLGKSFTVYSGRADCPPASVPRESLTDASGRASICPAAPVLRPSHSGRYRSRQGIFALRFKITRTILK